MYVVVAALPPGKTRGEVGVLVPAIETANPNLVVTPSLDPTGGYIITHLPTGRCIAQAGDLRAALVLLNRILAVSALYMIDWIDKPVLDACRRAAMRWALDPVAAMFHAPLPDAVPAMMDAQHSGIVLHDDVVATILGA